MRLATVVSISRQRGFYNNGFGLRWRWEIALVRDADEPVAKAEGENHFGCSGQKRNETQFSHSSERRVSNRARDFHRAESTAPFGKHGNDLEFFVVSHLRPSWDLI
jgi:hypothetical protein